MSNAYVPYISTLELIAESPEIPSVQFRVDRDLSERISGIDPERTVLLIQLADRAPGSPFEHDDEIRMDSDSRLSDLTRAIEVLTAVRDELARLEAAHD